MAALSQAGYPLVRTEATFFLYPEVPPKEDDVAFCDRLAELGVLVLPSSVFHDRGHFRISLTATDAPLDRALSILAGFRVAGAAA
jgi:aspartate aminotransferase